MALLLLFALLACASAFMMAGARPAVQMAPQQCSAPERAPAPKALFAVKTEADDLDLDNPLIQEDKNILPNRKSASALPTRTHD